MTDPNNVSNIFNNNFGSMLIKNDSSPAVDFPPPPAHNPIAGTTFEPAK